MANDMEAQIGADISEFDRAMDRVERRLDSFSRFNGGIIGGAMLVGPSVVPAIASLAAGVGALGASFAAAGAGVAAFGAVAVPTLTKVFEANKNIADLEEKVASATTSKEKAKAIKELEAAYAGLSDKQKETIGAMQDFGSFWDGFTKKFETPILDTFIGSMETAKTLLTSFEPVIQSTIIGVNKLFESFNRTLQADDMKAFFTWLGNNAGDSLVALSTTAGNVFRGLANIFMAFTPLMKEMESGMVSMTEKFVQWSQTFGSSNGFSQFLDYVRANGPVVLSIVGQLAKLIVNLGVAFAPIGAVVLKAVDSFLRFTNSLLEAHPAVGKFIAVLTVLAGGFMLVSGPIGMIIRLTMSVVRSFRTGGIAAILFSKAVATLTPVLMFLISPIGIVIAALTAMGVALVQLYKHNETFKNAVNSAWESVKNVTVAAAEAMKLALDSLGSYLKTIPAKFSAMGSAISSSFNSAIQGLSKKFSSIGSAISPVVDYIKSSFATIGNTIATLTPLIVRMGLSFLGVTGPVGWVIAIVASLGATIFKLINTNDQAKAALMSAWESIKSVISSVVSAIIPIVNSLAKGFMDAFAPLAPELQKTGQVIAESFASLGPAFAELGKAFGDLGTAIASLFGEVIKQVMPIATDLMKLFSDTVLQIMPQISDVIKQVSQVFTEFTSTYLPQFVQAFQQGLPVVLKVIQTVFEIAGLLIKGFGDIISIIATTVLPLILQAVQAVFPIIVSIIQAAIPIVIQLIQMFAQIITVIATTVIPVLLQVVQAVFPVILAIIQAAIPVVIAILQGLSTFITGVVVPAIQFILSIVQAVFPAIMGIIQSVIGIITNIIKLFTAVLQGDWSGAWNAVKGITQNVMSLIGNIIQGAISFITSVISGGLNLAKSIFSSVLSAISGLVSSIFSGISSVISSVMSAIGSIISSAWNGIQSVTSSVLNSVSSTVTNIWNNIKSFLSSIDLTGIGRNIMQGLLNGISSMASAIWDKVASIGNGIKDKLTGLFDIHSPSRWMENMIGVNMIKGWINGIQGMKSSMLGVASTMGEWMKPEMPNVQMAYSTPNVSSGIMMPSQAAVNNIQASNQSTQPRNMIIENVVMLDGYEIARSSQPYLDDMQTNKIEIKSYMRGGR